MSPPFDPQAGPSCYLDQLGRREAVLRNFQVKSIKRCSFCISSACLPLALSQHATWRLKPHDNMHELRANFLFLDWVNWDGKNHPNHRRYHSKPRGCCLKTKKWAEPSIYLSLLPHCKRSMTSGFTLRQTRLLNHRQMFSYIAFVRYLEITMGELTKINFPC